METGLLHLHGLLRWVVLIFGLLAVVKMMGGKNSQKKFTDGDRKPGLFFLITTDIQLLVGLMLYMMNGWMGQWSNAGAMMKDTVSRFYGMEHGLMMIIAVIFVHVGYAHTKKASNTDAQKFNKGFIFYLLALIIMIVMTPWPFREVGMGRGWF